MERFAAGEAIFVEGQPGDRLYVIDSGKVKITQCKTDGRERLLTVLGPQQIFGEVAVYDRGPRNSSATAITAVTVLVLDAVRLKKWMADSPRLAEQMLRLLARRLRRTTEDWTDVISNDVPGRLARRLLQLAQQFGSQEDGAMDLWHALTMDELAQLTGACSEDVSSALADFARRGWIRLDDKRMDHLGLREPCTACAITVP